MYNKIIERSYISLFRIFDLILKLGKYLDQFGSKDILETILSPYTRSVFDSSSCWYNFLFAHDNMDKQKKNTKYLLFLLFGNINNIFRFLEFARISFPSISTRLNRQLMDQQSKIWKCKI